VSKTLVQDDILVWLDADVVTFVTVPNDFIINLMDNTDLAFFGRGSYHSEIGFWAVRICKLSRHMLKSFAEIYDPVVSEPVVRKDPNDDPIIYTAVVGKADVICTMDQHFYDPPVLEFCRMRNIRVMTDVELLSLLAPQAGERAFDKIST